MFVGGGLMGNGHTPSEEERLFYQGCGPAQIDPVARRYYRYERIVQDIAIFCERVLASDESRENREQCYTYLASNFLPGNRIDIAYSSDRGLREG